MPILLSTDEEPLPPVGKPPRSPSGANSTWMGAPPKEEQQALAMAPLGSGILFNLNGAAKIHTSVASTPKQQPKVILPKKSTTSSFVYPPQQPSRPLRPPVELPRRATAPVVVNSERWASRPLSSQEVPKDSNHGSQGTVQERDNVHALTAMEFSSAALPHFSPDVEYFAKEEPDLSGRNPESPSSSGFGVSQPATMPETIFSFPPDTGFGTIEPKYEDNVGMLEDEERSAQPHNSQRAPDLSIIESEGPEHDSLDGDNDIIENSPIHSPRRDYAVREELAPIDLQEKIDQMDVDEESYEYTPLESGFATASMTRPSTSPFANRFLLRSGVAPLDIPASLDGNHVVPETGRVIDDVENSFDQQGTQDDDRSSGQHSNMIDDDIFASVAAEEAMATKQTSLAEDRADAMGKRFVTDKHTQFLQRTIGGQYAPLPQTLSGLYRRAESVGKSIFVQGRRSTDVFLARASDTAALPTGKLDATLLVHILSIQEDKSLLGLYSAKGRLAICSSEEAPRFRFAHLSPLLSNS